MPTAVERVLAAAGDPPLLGAGDALVVLVSGGRDSVCLLDLAVTLCGADRLLALHVNYRLRGAESDADEEHVRRLCRAAGVELDVFHPPAAPARGNLQAWARDTRYGEAVSRARDRQARVAAGHTASDQVETVLYRLAASPGRRALLGMAAVDGILIRPLLGVTRSETAAYCRERGLDWREDSTNTDAAYARNRCRSGLAAALGELHPAATENVLATARLLRDEAAVLDDVVSRVLIGRDRVELTQLAALSPGLARLVVIRLAEDAAGRLVPRVGGRLPELLGLAARGGSAQLDVGGGVRAVVEYGVLRFEPAGREAAPRAVLLAIPGTVRFGAWEVDCWLDLRRPFDADAYADADANADAYAGADAGADANADADADAGADANADADADADADAYAGADANADADAGADANADADADADANADADADADADANAYAGADANADAHADADANADAADADAAADAEAEPSPPAGDPRLGAAPAGGLRRPGAPGDPSVEIGRLDADILEPGVLTVRAWRAGDRIAPVGLGGTKTLADLFTDNRIPRAERRTRPVIACGHEVAWVPGLATGERFRVSSRTTRVAVLRASPAPGPPRLEGGRGPAQ